MNDRNNELGSLTV